MESGALNRPIFPLSHPDISVTLIFSSHPCGQGKVFDRPREERPGSIATTYFSDELSTADYRSILDRRGSCIRVGRVEGRQRIGNMQPGIREAAARATLASLESEPGGGPVGEPTRARARDRSRIRDHHRLGSFRERKLLENVGMLRDDQKRG
ncbi:unnamed protein product [Xylocopa violacea]|uniref:Ribosomal protein S14 n=1 Tax=Xylocopa violacea TaxID=135666 RepID=A0ABP1PBU5_XYLVO